MNQTVSDDKTLIGDFENNIAEKGIKDYSRNKYEIFKYYNVGKMLVEAGKHYGENVIKEYSNKLKE